MAGLIFVLSAPSGAGKSTLCRELMKSIPSLVYSVSMTTRSPRRGEKDGLHYHFVTREQFEEMVRQDGFLEHADVFGNSYGTPKLPIENAFARGKDILMDVDVQGAMKIRSMKNAVFIFVLPPSMAILEKRLTQRQTDDENQIRKRIAMARQEIACAHRYDYVVFNDDLGESVRALKSIVEAERSRFSCRKEALQEMGFNV